MPIFSYYIVIHMSREKSSANKIQSCGTFSITNLKADAL